MPAHTEQHRATAGALPGLRKLNRRQRLAVLLRSRHAYDPYFEAGADCWCGRGPRNWIHGNRRHACTRSIHDTPLGQAIKDHTL